MEHIIIKQKLKRCFQFRPNNYSKCNISFFFLNYFYLSELLSIYLKSDFENPFMLIYWIWFDPLLYIYTHWSSVCRCSTAHFFSFFQLIFEWFQQLYLIKLFWDKQLSKFWKCGVTNLLSLCITGFWH